MTSAKNPPALTIKIKRMGLHGCCSFCPFMCSPRICRMTLDVVSTGSASRRLLCPLMSSFTSLRKTWHHSVTGCKLRHAEKNHRVKAFESNYWRWFQMIFLSDKCMIIHVDVVLTVCEWVILVPGLQVHCCHLGGRFRKALWACRKQRQLLITTMIGSLCNMLHVRAILNRGSLVIHCTHG